MTSPIILALDYDNTKSAFALLEQLEPPQCRIKIGKNMFTRYGARFVKDVVNLGFDVFLDLKFHDIPQTVYDACRAAVDLGIWMVNVHACGGAEMLKKASLAVNGQCKLIAVTILTSMQQADFNWLGFPVNIRELALKLAQLAQENNLNGVVASAHEARDIKITCGDDFEIISPGIRLEGDEQNDQKRIMTPITALNEGVDYLVIGRSITQSSQPYSKLVAINKAIAGFEV